MPDKIAWANQLYDLYGQELLDVLQQTELIPAYREAIARTWRQMECSGVVQECTVCAVKDGGSCCGRGIEDRFDVTLLLVNRLMGASLPSKPADPTGCWFLGDRGCNIVARHVICVNYICPRLTAHVDGAALQALQVRIAEETDAAFMLEEFVKRWLQGRGL